MSKTRKAQVTQLATRRRGSADTLIVHWSMMLSTRGPEAVAADIRQTVDREWDGEGNSYGPLLLELTRDVIDAKIAELTRDAYPNYRDESDTREYPLLIESRRIREGITP